MICEPGGYMRESTPQRGGESSKRPFHCRCPSCRFEIHTWAPEYGGRHGQAAGKVYAVGGYMYLRSGL